MHIHVPVTLSFFLCGVSNDMQIACRMSLLVLVDAACWLPMAVLGLSATFARVYLVDKSTAKVR